MLPGAGDTAMRKAQPHVPNLLKGAKARKGKAWAAGNRSSSLEWQGRTPLMLQAEPGGGGLAEAAPQVHWPPIHTAAGQGPGPASWEDESERGADQLNNHRQGLRTVAGLINSCLMQRK